MRYKRHLALLLAMFLIIGLAVAGGCKKAAPKPLPSAPASDTKPAKMIIGYYENPWPGTPDQSGSFPSMKAFAKSMTHVAPFWYRATADGTLETKESQLVYDTAKQSGLKVFPLVTNKSGATDNILGDPAIRSKVINNIEKIVKEKPYDGVNIDFELLPPKHKDNLNAFMAELYPRLKALNKTVVISIFPKIDVAEDVSGAYDYGTLAKNSDFLQIMLYDRHWSTSEPGAVAPIDWYEKNLKYAVEQAGGPNKVIAGISAYGYDWPKGNAAAETIKYADAIVLAKKHGVEILYDETVQAPHFKYTDHEVWFENSKSTDAKLEIVKKYNVPGIAIWRLGQEQPEIWGLIDKKFPKGQ